MRITLVVAASTNNVIGRDGGLPWHLSEDLRRFKEITLGHPVIMGRLTYESIGRPLPGRQNIVISTRPGYAPDAVTVVRSPAEALRAAGDVDEVMIIGGGQVYELFLQYADRIHLTRVDVEIDGDTFFPELDAAWRMVADEPRDAGDGADYAFRFQTFERC